MKDEEPILVKILPVAARRILTAAADRLIPYSNQFSKLEERVTAEAQRIATLESINTADTQRIATLESINTADAQRIATLEAISTAYQERVAHLEAHNSALTEAAILRERELQKKAELDYQLLMIHQQLLAEFSDAEPRFRELYERCKPYTMTSIERLYSLYMSVEYIVKAEIPGDLAECGVWRGGSCMMMAYTLLSLGKCDRHIMLYDTFEGHPQPDPKRDIDLWGNRAHDEWRQRTERCEVEGWASASIDEVRQNLARTGYPVDKLRYIKGMVEETARQNASQRLSLLRLDTDWYESTRSALRHLYPSLASGGVLILDDYGHYKGQRDAADEYFQEIGEHLLLHRIDYSCRVAVKP